MALTSSVSVRRKKVKGAKYVEIETFVHKGEGKNECKDVEEEESKRIVFGQLLRRILKGLDSRSLLQCARLVSKSWRNEATWILRNQYRSEPCLVTTFKFHTGKNKFILSQSKTLERNQNQSDPKEQRKKNENEKEQDVSKLIGMFNSCPSHNFPCAHFHFEGGSLDCPQILEFFSVYGKNVRKLTVDVRKNPLGIAGALRRKVFKLTPKLESLELMDSNKWTPWNSGINEPDESIELQINPSQDHCLGQLATLKSLKFADSLDCFNKIQKLYKCLEPELALNSNFSISISTFEIPCTISDAELDSDLGFANIAHLIQVVNSVALQLCDPHPKNIRKLKQLAECRLKFKYIQVHASCSETLSRMSSTDFTETGNILWKIMDGTREALRNFHCPAESFFLLTRQPLFPGFFCKLKTLLITFESDFGAQVFTRYSGPPLWKNLSEVMPSLKNVLLFFFDGDCLIESWMPLFDANAGQNLSVKKLHLSCVGRRELLQKIILSFPSLTTLTLKVNIIPPPKAMDSVQNMICWLFTIFFENRNGSGHKRAMNENIPQKPAFCSPFKQLKSLDTMKLIVNNCGGIQHHGNPTGSSLVSSKSHCASPVLNECSLSKIRGRQWILIGDPEDFESWRETFSSDSEEKNAVDSNNLDFAPSTLSNKVCIDVSCKKH